MAATNTTPSVLTGLFKEVYGDSQINLIPDNSKLQKLIKFVPGDKELGNKYHQNVIVTMEHGVSYASADGGTFALNDALSMKTQDAQIQGSQMVIRAGMSYDAAARADKGKKSFALASSMQVESMVESISKRLEISMLYGQCSTGLATCAVAASGSSVVVCTVTAGTWAPGIWTGMETARVAVKVGANVKGPFSISAIDFDDRKITLAAATEAKGSDAGTGVLGDIDDEATAYLFFLGSVAVADGSTTFREMIGLENLITKSGSLFNINNSTYNLWAGNSATVSGQLTIGKILSSLGQPIAKGLEEDVVCFVNPDTWADLASDLSALREFDQSYSSAKGENGVKSICYYSQNGKIEVISHSCVKAGECFVFPPKRFKRIGASDITFKTPGRGEDIFTPLPDAAGYEIRAFTDQALFPEAVAKCLKISGFTNS